MSDAEIAGIEADFAPLIEQAAAKQGSANPAYCRRQRSSDCGRGRSLETSNAQQLFGSPLQQWWGDANKSRKIEFVRDVGKPLALKADALEVTRDAV